MVYIWCKLCGVVFGIFGMVWVCAAMDKDAEQKAHPLSTCSAHRVVHRILSGTLDGSRPETEIRCQSISPVYLPSLDEAIFMAVENNWVDKFAQCLSSMPPTFYGPLTLLKNLSGETLLHVSARGNHIRITAALLKFWKNVDVCDDKGVTPLMCAARYNPLDVEPAGSAWVVKLLLDAGADYKLQDRRGLSALHFAAHSGYYTAMQRLLGAGCPVDMRCSEVKSEATPLHIAAYKGHSTCVDLLLACGADPLATTLHKKTARDIAERKKAECGDPDDPRHHAYQRIIDSLLLVEHYRGKIEKL